MKKIIEGIPYALLLVLTPYLFLKEPSVAQALIVGFVAGLSGYRYHLDSVKQPNYIKLFKEELSQLKKENKDFRDKYGKMAMEKGSKKPLDSSFRW
jgi:hypothetical protein